VFQLGCHLERILLTIRLIIKSRMPVILQPEDEEQWHAHDVSPMVNSAKYDGPECIQPLSEEDVPRSGQLSLL
jgi:hypothetical protein